MKLVLNTSVIEKYARKSQSLFHKQYMLYIPVYLCTS